MWQVKRRRLIYAFATLFSTLIFFQNCSVGGGLTVSSSAYDAMMASDLDSVRKIEFYHVGGLPGPAPVTTRSLILEIASDRQSAIAFHVLNLAGVETVCQRPVDLSELSGLANALASASIGKDTSGVLIADAGDQFLKLTLRDGRVQTNKFVGGDTSNVGLVIFGDALKSALDGVLNRIACP